MTVDAQAALDARYGRAPRRVRRWWLVALIVILSGIAVGWYVFFGPQTASPKTTSVTAEVASTRILDARHLNMTFTVTAPADRAYACAINATAQDFSIVGWKVLTMGPSPQTTRTFSHTLLTTQRGTAGFVDSCWLT